MTSPICLDELWILNMLTASLHQIQLYKKGSPLVCIKINTRYIAQKVVNVSS